ncbi:MAG: PadR family transcriptional regulator [Methanobrevibacter sp.]|uniref:PadR family transcriptional regulator n=1 Tax=Methanobrevibacter sp. TaxID=66852 RepID=UPI0025CC3CDE|nr:PadR family transcriptional regulator [Methanobrevibacter sp.]MBR0271747.1 PadR family transcriptional regulator [Methanobrevibacter sp.]
MNDIADEDFKSFINQNKIMMKNLSNALIRHIIIYLLKNEELYGYLLMKKIDDFFKPQIEKGIMKKIPSSKIYPILNKMEKEGLIRSYESEHNNMKIKVYSSTEKGLKVYDLVNLEIKESIERTIWQDFLKDIK